MIHDDIKATLQALLPRYTIEVKPPFDGLCTVTGTVGEKRRYMYVEASRAHDEVYLKSRADLLAGKKRMEE